MFSFDPIMAKILHFPCTLLNYVLILLISLVIIHSIFIVGTVMAIGLLITPAATALLICQRLGPMMFYASLFGVTGVLGGLYSSFWMNTNSGSTVILFCALQFLIAFIFSSKQGLILKYKEKQKKKSIQLQENILRQMIKHGEKQFHLNQIFQYLEPIKSSKKKIQQVIQILKEEKWIFKVKKQTYELTDKGKQKALRIHRAHRLWETYFYQRGEKIHQLHERAEQKQNPSRLQPHCSIRSLAGPFPPVTPMVPSFPKTSTPRLSKMGWPFLL